MLQPVVSKSKKIILIVFYKFLEKKINSIFKKKVGSTVQYLFIIVYHWNKIRNISDNFLTWSRQQKIILAKLMKNKNGKKSHILNFQIFSNLLCSLSWIFFIEKEPINYSFMFYIGFLLVVMDVCFLQFFN